MPKTKEENMDEKHQSGSTKDKGGPVKEEVQGEAKSKFSPLPEGTSDFTLPADIKNTRERRQHIRKRKYIRIT